MYLNILVNSDKELKVAAVSIAEMLAIQRDMAKKSSSIIGIGDEAQLDAWEAQASEMTAASWAAEDAGLPTVSYTSNGDGTFTEAIQNDYSSLGYATVARDKSNEIKAVEIRDPVTSVPNNPDGSTGVPTVDYDAATGEFIFGVPVGKQGLTGQSVTMEGSATIAQMDAIDVVTTTVGATWLMLESGTINNPGASQPVTVIVDDAVTWAAEGYFINQGALVGPTGATGATGLTGADSTVPGPQGADSTVPGPQGADSTVPGPQGDPGADSTVPGPQGDPGADSTVPGPQGPSGPAGIGLIFHGYEAPAVVITLTATAIGDAYTANATGVDSDGLAVVIGDVMVADDLAVPSHWVNIGAIQGPTGAPGEDGTNGTNGTDGADSTVPGPQGVPGADSTVPGPQGVPGADSTVPGPAGPSTPSVDVGNTLVAGSDSLLFNEMPTASQVGALGVADTAADATQWAGAVKYVIAEGAAEPTGMVDGDILFIYTP